MTHTYIQLRIVRPLFWFMLNHIHKVHFPHLTLTVEQEFPFKKILSSFKQHNYLIKVMLGKACILMTLTLPRYLHLKLGNIITINISIYSICNFFKHLQILPLNPLNIPKNRYIFCTSRLVNRGVSLSPQV